MLNQVTKIESSRGSDDGSSSSSGNSSSSMVLACRLLAEVNEECGQGYVSSSSDGEDFGGPSVTKSQSRWPHLKLQSSMDVSEYSTSAVRDTFAPKSCPQPQHYKPSLHGPQTTGERCLCMSDVSFFFMAALCNKAGHIYFHPVVCSSSFFFFLV